MKTAVKVLSILSIVFCAFIILILLVLQGPVKEFITRDFEEGKLIIDGVVTTDPRDLELMLIVVTIIFGFCIGLAVLSIILMAFNIYFSNKDSKTGILVMGILDFCFGNVILAILNILDYADIEKRNKTEEKPNTITFE